MWKLSDLIELQEVPIELSTQVDTKGMPIISPKSLDWAYRKDPKRLTKSFTFSSESTFNAFVVDILEHQSETQHHGRITLQFPKVKIEVWTRSLNDITEIDAEWASAVNEIYEGYHG